MNDPISSSPSSSSRRRRGLLIAGTLLGVLTLLDLLALAAEEAAHFDRSIEGHPTTVRGIQACCAGIPMDEHEKIFEPFHRSPRPGSSVTGFGLGLALVRQIARAHGGDVRYSAVEQGGSRFTVMLPAIR
jgi:Histidine kinase-, DNA gyrase B-, and HSP90-like ATPase